MKIVDTKCPNCGAETKVDLDTNTAVCEYCGATILIYDETQHVKFDNAEQAGYDFEKGRQRAKAETVQSINAPTKKRRTWLWVLGWIFIFPLPLTIIVLKSKKLKTALKIIILILAWIIYLIWMIPAIANSGSKKQIDTETTIETAESAETTSSKTAQEQTTKELYTTGPEEIEMNPLQLLFISLNPDTTMKDVKGIIDGEGFKYHEYSSNGGYNIGYGECRVSSRPVDREGENLEISFTNNGTKLKSAQFTLYGDGFTSYALEYRDGIFYYKDQKCKDGYEAMQLYLSNTK